MTTTESPKSNAVPAQSTPATAVSERQARQVAEAARETEWQKPSFGKQLFLGRLKLGLIDPWPQPSDESVAKGEAYLAKLGDYASTIDVDQIERDAFIPDDVFVELGRLGAFGMKIDEQYGGLGLSNLD